MADKKITDLSTLTAADADDYIPIVDSSTNTTKKLAAAGLAAAVASALPNGSITPSKLALAPQNTTVATSQTTTSSTFTDLATVGPVATVAIGANGLALVLVSCDVQQTSTTAASLMGFAVSGATTVAANDVQAIYWRSANNNLPQSQSRAYLVTGLTPGSNTFTAKYRATGGTGTFINRTLSVIPL